MRFISQAEYMDGCFALCTSKGWREEYHQAPPGRRCSMIQKVVQRLASDRLLTANRPNEMVEYAADEEETDKFWKKMNSRCRKAYLNEKKRIQILARKEDERERTFGNTRYLLADETSALWSLFCTLKLAYAHNLQCHLRVAQQTALRLEELCKVCNVPTGSTSNVVRRHNRKQRNERRTAFEDAKSMARRVVHTRDHVSIRVPSAQAIRKTTFRRRLAECVNFASGFVGVVFGRVSTLAQRTRRR